MNKKNPKTQTLKKPSVCGGLTEADVRGLGQRGGGLIGPEAVLLPQLVPLLQRQDDGSPAVPLPLAVLLHTVEELLPLCFMTSDNTCTDVHNNHTLPEHKPILQTL